MGILIEHLDREWKAGSFSSDQIHDDLHRLLTEVENMGYFGTQLLNMIDLFSTLAHLNPITPLTGSDHEWEPVGDGVYQNIRDPNVFKSPARYHGQAFNIAAVVYVTPAGVEFITSSSCKAIEFPYVYRPTLIPVHEGSIDKMLGVIMIVGRRPVLDEVGSPLEAITRADIARPSLKLVQNTFTRTHGNSENP